MDAKSSGKLCRVSHPFLQRNNAKMSWIQVGSDNPNNTEQIVLTLLWWVGRGHWGHHQALGGVSRVSLCCHHHLTIDAIDQAPELQCDIHWTQTQQSNTEARFSEISTSGVLDGHAMHTNCFLLQVVAPSSGKMPDAESHSSGNCKACEPMSKESVIANADFCLQNWQSQSEEMVLCLAVEHV